MRAVDLFDGGVEALCIARKLRVSEKSVYQWRRTWRTCGREALRSRGPLRLRLSARPAPADQARDVA
ncbi:helix-turn-helix domain-containing protein [Streptomyces sp. NPDC102437]|uniref:helix-turn-helix domain-containing protein n=1 Tax=Streptomyces sp. NPDC102437 TaxID=3366175 RepID=UPI003823929E